MQHDKSRPSCNNICGGGMIVNIYVYRPLKDHESLESSSLGALVMGSSLL